MTEVLEKDNFEYSAENAPGENIEAQEQRLKTLVRDCKDQTGLEWVSFGEGLPAAGDEEKGQDQNKKEPRPPIDNISPRAQKEIDNLHDFIESQLGVKIDTLDKKTREALDACEYRIAATSENAKDFEFQKLREAIERQWQKQYDKLAEKKEERAQSWFKKHAGKIANAAWLTAGMAVGGPLGLLGVGAWRGVKAINAWNKHVPDWYKPIAEFEKFLEKKNLSGTRVNRRLQDEGFELSGNENTHVSATTEEENQAEKDRWLDGKKRAIVKIIAKKYELDLEDDPSKYDTLLRQNWNNPRRKKELHRQYIKPHVNELANVDTPTQDNTVDFTLYLNEADKHFKIIADQIKKEQEEQLKFSERSGNKLINDFEAAYNKLPDLGDLEQYTKKAVQAWAAQDNRTPEEKKVAQSYTQAYDNLVKAGFNPFTIIENMETDYVDFE